MSEYTPRSEWLAPKDVAKVARRELKKAFKGTKFTVRTDLYAGGSSIRVRWSDGPTVDEVNEIVGWMHGGNFDGMTDSMSYHDSVLFGEKVHFGNTFIFTNRDVSENLFRYAVARVAADWGPDVDKFKIDVSDWSGAPNEAYFAGNESFGNLDTLTVQRLVREIIAETTV